jgi:hypothetical protein
VFAIAAGLILLWLILVLLGKGGLVHVLVLVAITFAVVKFMNVRRARF